MVSKPIWFPLFIELTLAVLPTNEKRNDTISRTKGVVDTTGSKRVRRRMIT